MTGYFSFGGNELTTVIEGGSHFMVYDRADEVTFFLRNTLENYSVSPQTPKAIK